LPAQVLVDSSLELVLANAAQVKNVPGRKSDVRMPRGFPSCWRTGWFGRALCQNLPSSNYGGCCALASSWWHGPVGGADGA
jgi:hypothetical protein